MPPDHDTGALVMMLTTMSKRLQRHRRLSRLSLQFRILGLRFEALQDVASKRTGSELNGANVTLMCD